MGPPWAKRENGFLFTETVDGGVSLYYEPHCDYDVQSLQGTDSVDIVITPGVNQELLSFPLVCLFSPRSRPVEGLPCHAACLSIGVTFSASCLQYDVGNLPSAQPRALVQAKQDLTPILAAGHGKGQRCWAAKAAKAKGLSAFGEC